MSLLIISSSPLMALVHRDNMRIDAPRAEPQRGSSIMHFCSLNLGQVRQHFMIFHLLWDAHNFQSGVRDCFCVVI